jgi:hypothetical protein
MNSRLFVGGDVSFNSRLMVQKDVSLNSRLFVGGDVSMNQRLFVLGDASFNGNVVVFKNVLIQGNMVVSGTQTAKTQAITSYNNPVSTSITIDCFVNNSMHFVNSLTGNFTCNFTNVAAAVGLSTFITTIVIVPASLTSFGFGNTITGNGLTNLWFNGGVSSINITNPKLIIQTISIINNSGTYYATSNVTNYAS